MSDIVWTTKTNNYDYNAYNKFWKNHCKDAKVDFEKCEGRLRAKVAIGCGYQYVELFDEGRVLSYGYMGSSQFHLDGAKEFSDLRLNQDCALMLIERAHGSIFDYMFYDESLAEVQLERYFKHYVHCDKSASKEAKKKYFELLEEFKGLKEYYGQITFLLADKIYKFMYNLPFEVDCDYSYSEGDYEVFYEVDQLGIHYKYTMIYTVAVIQLVARAWAKFKKGGAKNV